MKNKNNLFHFLGTFDPPHYGHYHVYMNTKRMIGEQGRLVVGITQQNPQKETPMFAPFQRLEKWLRLIEDEKGVIENEIIYRGNNNFNAVKYDNSLFVIDNHPNTYEYINTMSDISSGGVGICNHLVMGGDQLLNFHTWYKHEELLNLLETIVVFSRGIDEMDLIKYIHTTFPSKIHKFKIYQQALNTTENSTEIRKKILQ